MTTVAVHLIYFLHFREFLYGKIILFNLCGNIIANLRGNTIIFSIYGITIITSEKTLLPLISVVTLSLTPDETFPLPTSMVTLSLTSGETLSLPTSVVALSLTSMNTTSRETADFFLSSSQPRGANSAFGCQGSLSVCFPICYEFPGPSQHGFHRHSRVVRCNFARYIPAYYTDNTTVATLTSLRSLVHT
jgi:hypothetical protein